jgi:hypothetical protein
LWTTSVNDVNAVAITTTPIMTTLTVPTGVQVWAMMNASVTATTAPTSLLLNSSDESAQAARPCTSCAWRQRPGAMGSR